MGTINELLRKLDNRVPASISKRLEGLITLQEKLNIAKAEHNENPTEDSKEKLEEISEFISDTQEILKNDLQELVEKKNLAERKQLQERELRAREAKEREEREARERQARERQARERQAREREEKEARERRARQLQAREKEAREKEAREKEAREKEAREKEAKDKEILEKAVLDKDITENDSDNPKEKKSGIGWGGLILGGTLLILSAGAINYFGKKR
jgi:hypothetical protein